MSVILCLALVLFCGSTSAQGVKRLVVVKIDGLPGHYVDRFVKERDRETGRSILPWFDEVFYRGGTRVPNFYTRGMSISGPSWGQLDTGQRLQIKGNVEYDRHTLHTYDYLNFLPFQIDYGLGKKADMPATEVMDQLGIPLVADAFDYERRYTSQQLYQRGNSWEVVGSGFVNLYPGNARDFIDEWTLGLDFRKMTINQTERDILGKLIKRPQIDYFDYYDVSFDHVSHHNNDTDSRLAALKQVDRLIGRIWVAIQSSSRAGETALVLISDHGTNSVEKVYSQGFNLVRLLGSKSGGGHHVVTKRRLMLDYSVKGVYPLVPLIRTNSSDSFYLKGQSSDYSTALLDFDGNERATIHLRNSDLNVLHLLLKEVKTGRLDKPLKLAAEAAFLAIIDKHREKWQLQVREVEEELSALQRWVNDNLAIVRQQPKKFSAEDIEFGRDKAARRHAALVRLSEKNIADQRNYITKLRNLLALERGSFDARNVEVPSVIAPLAMGDPNTVSQLQNYVVGLAPEGLSLRKDAELDLDRSFTRVNYFELLHSQRVRNNVQPAVGNRPVDFIAVAIPLESFADSLPADMRPTEDPIWLYGGPEKQTLILARSDESGNRSFRYVPISRLYQTPVGTTLFQRLDWAPGFPLRYFEDEKLAVPKSERISWLDSWHTETEWLAAIHETKYSNALLGLNEQLDRHPVVEDGEKLSSDDVLIKRFRQRQRNLTEPDLLILANDHWNFDVRGFNPGGNHGSFFRTSTNSAFMLAGGAGTGIPRGLRIEKPYDSLSFVPTILRLMGKVDAEGRPNDDLTRRGFKRFPGRIIAEVTDPALSGH